MNKQEQELRKKSPIQIRNKKASFEYFFVDTYTAGIVLTSVGYLRSEGEVIIHSLMPDG